MKAAIGGILHETNTYVTNVRGKTMLDGMVIKRGQDLIEHIAGTNFWGGFVDAPLKLGWDLVPTTLAMFGESFGMVDTDEYQKIKKEILDGIQAAMPLDVVLMTNHGAGVTEHIHDLEGDLVSSIRELVGPDVKIISTLDLHGKCTPLSIASCDFINCVHLYPHNDTHDRNCEAVELVPSLISGELVPTLHVERVPIAFAVCTTDEGSFAHEILLKVKEINKREDVVACGVLHGFPYQDSEFVAMSVMVTTNDDEALAEKIAKELAQWIWDNRERTLFKGYTTDQLIAKAGELLEKQGRKLVREGPVDLEKLAYGFFPDPIKQDQEKKGGLLATGALPDYSDQNRADYGPVVICDYSDNPGSGAAGDITFLLRAMIDAKLEHACMLGINDPETVQQAIDAGVGQIIKVRLGGKLDSVERGGGPIEADAYVKSISDGKIMDSCLMRGFKMDMRSTVMLIVNGVDVVVSSGYFQTLDDAFGRYHGIKPADYRVVAVKSANHFREYYRKIAVEILIADTPGLAAGAVTEFKYSCLDHDVYPHQQDARYPIS